MAAFLIFLFMRVFCDTWHLQRCNLNVHKKYFKFLCILSLFFFLANPSVDNLCYCEQKTEEGVSKQIYNFVTDGKADFN